MKNKSQDIHDTAVVVLQKKEEEKKPSWNLRTVSVGCALDAEVGLGPIVSFGFVPRIRFIFSNSNTPPIP